MKKIFVAGHNGMVGSAICRKLATYPDIKILTRSRNELDLCDQSAVFDFFQAELPDEVILAAAKVGGIYANNTFPADFIYQNIQIQNNVIHSSHLCDVKKLLFLGSSCIYPRNSKQPIEESSLLTGALEPTNEPYAIAKIAGIKMCESYRRQYDRDYRAVMPTNLYGPGDNYSGQNSHVVPALIKKMHIAKLNSSPVVGIWGSGRPKREFLYVDDMAEACLTVHLMSNENFYSTVPDGVSHVNIGCGEDIGILELAILIKDIVGFDGQLEFDKSKPDGVIRKLLDTSLVQKLEWKPSTPLKVGLKLAYDDFLARHDKNGDII